MVSSDGQGRSSRTVRASLLVFFLSIVVIVLFSQFVPPEFAGNESHDYTRFYEPVARGILRGQGLRLDDGCLAVRYPPGYPAYLAGLFGLAGALNVPEDPIVAIAILLITALTATLVFRIARTLWSDGWSVIAALAWLVYPFNLWLTKQTNSETPYLLLLYAALALYWELEVSESESRPRYVAVGLLLGLAMLVRPVAIAICAILAVYTWIRRSGRSSRRARAILIAALLLGSAIVVAPWELWVFGQSGQLIVLSTGSRPSAVDGITFMAGPEAMTEGVGAPADVVAMMERLDERRDELESTGQVVGAFIEEARVHPSAAMKLLALKAGRSWFGTHTGRMERTNLLIQAVVLSVLGWSFAIAWKRRGRHRQYAILSAAIVLCYWGMTSLVRPLLRYMVPAIGLLFVLLPGCLIRVFGEGGILRALPCWSVTAVGRLDCSPRHVGRCRRAGVRIPEAD